MLTDLRERTVQVRTRLLVHHEHIGPRSAEVVDEPLGALDHEVNVEDAPGGVHQRAQRAHDRRAERNDWGKVTVHNVDVDNTSAGSEDLFDLLAEPREVRREDRGGYVRVVQQVLHERLR